MTELLILLVFVGLIGFVLFKPKWSAPETKPSGPSEWQHYSAANSLFVNASERTFFHIMQSQLPDGFFLHSKVRLEDIIRVKSGLPKQQLWSLRGRIKSRHVDFLITDAQGRPCLVIELDGRSHTRQAARNADRLKDGIFAAANIPFFRVKTGENFNKYASDFGRMLKSP